MDKNSYLELARENGWNKKIPRLPDGTYDCDIFGGDGVTMSQVDFGNLLCISGNLILEDFATVCELKVGESAFFSDYADTLDVTAGIAIFFADYADVGTVSANLLISFGVEACCHGGIYCPGKFVADTGFYSV